ncbi:ABC transporter substrate-binding protein [Streptacidiphilus jiangxiensis]|uniref:Peptide/nickel transport system substrate-binding protein n=1 Tax=Streptacidiphilus jiangxiensis TaxID=235985 RepID=A0A1H7ZA48_STRJI|nr:ABC transporter substrate-binding protein [Streptacidiphilus jiangxiensis]SEM54349.1 peptide/nickel transport system substrate-binding protein [Streptacidiphilus jiangxiensis]
MSALKRAAALSCIGLIATTTACGSSKSASPVGGAPSVTIKVGSANAFTTLDPANAYDQGSWEVYYNIYQGLFTYAPGGNTPSPDLATGKCALSSDQLTATCDIRSGVKFSNGDPLDATAVKFSLDRVARIKSGTGVNALFSTIKSVDVASPTEVKIHLTTPDATLEDRLASGVASIVDPKVFSGTKAEPNNFTDVVGSGRYKVDSVTFGDLGGTKQPTEIKLSLNPNYQGAASAPQNSAVDIKYYADQAGTKAALDSKDVDVVIQDLNASDIVSMQNDQQLGTGLQVFQGPGGTVRLMSFNTLKGVFKNVKVRQAVAELINRDTIAENAYKHTVTPAYSIMPAGIANESESFSAYTSRKVSAATVKSNLEKAGIQLPVKFTLDYGQGDAAKAAEVQMIQQQLDQSGIFDVTLKGFKGGFGEMQKAVLGNGKFDAFMVAWSADYLDADDYISPMVGGQGPGPLYNSWHSTAVNTLIAQGLNYPTRTAAFNVYKQVQEDIANAVPVLPIWTNSQYAAAQSNVTGVPLTLDSSGNNRWWMIGKNS